MYPPLSVILIRDKTDRWTLAGYGLSVGWPPLTFTTSLTMGRGQMLHGQHQPVSTRGIYKVSPCDNHKMDNWLQSGCLYLDFRSIGDNREASLPCWLIKCSPWLLTMDWIFVACHECKWGTTKMFCWKIGDDHWQLGLWWREHLQPTSHTEYCYKLQHMGVCCFLSCILDIPSWKTDAHNVYTPL